MAAATKDEKKKAGPASATLTRGQALALRSPAAARGTWLVASAVLTLVMAMATYIAVLGVAVYVVPMSMSMVASMQGAPLEQLSMVQVIGVWLAPGLCLVLLVTWLLGSLVRSAWRWRACQVRRMRTWFLGEGPVPEPTTDPAATIEAVAKKAEQAAQSVKGRRDALRSTRKTLRNEETN